MDFAEIVDIAKVVYSLAVTNEHCAQVRGAKASNITKPGAAFF
jgi:hypothetical protein